MGVVQRKGWIAFGFLLGSIAACFNMWSCGNMAHVEAQQPASDLSVVAYEKCNKYAITTVDEEVLYAEREFPGWSIADIMSRVSVVGKSTVEIPGYELMNRTGWIPQKGDWQSEMLVRDGAAAVICGYAGANAPEEPATIAFIWR